MQPDLTTTKLRAIQYFYIDGTFEFTFGGLCLFLAGFFFIQASVPDRLSGNLLSLALMVVIPLSAMLINRLIWRFKEQVTYPRTGYVAYLSEQGSQRRVRLALELGTAFIVGGAVAAYVTRKPETLDWMAALTSVVFGLVLAFIGFRSRLTRFYLLGMLVLLSGVVLSILGYGNIPGLALFYGLTSLILFCSGGMTLWAYIHHNPPANEAAHES
jgi:drug/metabolite transporter (DMT)-like permease